MEELKKYDPKQVFKTPDNYMDEVTGKIMKKTGENVAGAGRRGIIELVKPHLVMAAAMTGLVIIGYTTLRLLLPDQNGTGSTLNMDEIALYLSDSTDEIYLVEALGQEGESGTAAGAVITLSDKEIIDYLVDERVPVERLELIEQ